jgi:DNA-binding MarR family transcriptional regulator
MTDDAADRHVARWRDHWIDVPFDPEVEGIVVRIGHLMRYLRATKEEAAAKVGLQGFEYDTLHSLMIRDTPGLASPGSLASDLGVSPAGITGRLDSLEKAGYLQRSPGPDDRRTIVVEVTAAGADIWRRAMAMRGAAEEELVQVLAPAEQKTLNRLLKKMMLTIEGD